MKMRNKGKVHPFTSSSSSSSSSSHTNTDTFSVLKLLPAAILTLLSFLSLEDREVLAYMITRSLNVNEDKKKTSKSHCCGGAAHNSPALFHCDCFHCYTSFWFRWDSSPNRELIHQAIEAFDDHLNTAGDHFKNAKARRRDKLGRRRIDKLISGSPENQESAVSAAAAEELVDEVEVGIEGVGAEKAEEEEAGVAAPAPAVVVRTHKGLARKVLPDVMGIFNSRLWSLWSPNV